MVTNRVLSSAYDEQLQIIEETVEGGTIYYNLMVGTHEVPCINYKDAEKRYGNILREMGRNSKGEY